MYSLFYRQSFDRDKEAAAAHQSYSILQSIKRTVLTRQSFVSHLQSPDPSRVYKEVQYRPASGLVWSGLNTVTMAKVSLQFKLYETETQIFSV